MKRIVNILIILLTLFSCKKENQVQVKEKDIVFASIKGLETKTQIGTNSILSWSENDTIGILGDKDDNPSEFILRSGAGYSTASFSGEIPGGDTYIVYSPSSAICDGITYRGFLDTKVSHAVPSHILGTVPLWGRFKDLSLVNLECICGILQLNLFGSIKLQSITLDAGVPISGQFLCSLAEGVMAMIGGANIIVMDASSTELFPSRPTPFYFILPPGEYDMLKFTISDKDGELYYLTVDDIIVEKGFLTPMDYNLDNN